MEVQFDKKNVPWLKEYLTNRGIQVTDQGRTKRKAELVELAVKAREIKLQRIDEDDEDISDVIAGKLRTEKGTIPRLENIQNWSYDFSKMPPFTFADLYMYLIGSGEYTAENLKSFKSTKDFWHSNIFLTNAQTKNLAPKPLFASLNSFSRLTAFLSRITITSKLTESLWALKWDLVMLTFLSASSNNNFSTFLDINVSISGNRLSTSVHYKPTDSHTYLLHSSSHPAHAKNSIPYS